MITVGIIIGLGTAGTLILVSKVHTYRKLIFQQGKQFVFVAIIALKVNARDAKTVDSIKITIYTKQNREKELSNSQNCEIFNLTDGHII